MSAVVGKWSQDCRGCGKNESEAKSMKKSHLHGGMW